MIKCVVIKLVSLCLFLLVVSQPALALPSDHQITFGVTGFFAKKETPFFCLYTQYETFNTHNLGVVVNLKTQLLLRWQLTVEPAVRFEHSASNKLVLSTGAGYSIDFLSHSWMWGFGLHENIKNKKIIISTGSKLFWSGFGNYEILGSKIPLKFKAVVYPFFGIGL